MQISFNFKAEIFSEALTGAGVFLEAFPGALPGAFPEALPEAFPGTFLEALPEA